MIKNTLSHSRLQTLERLVKYHGSAYYAMECSEALSIIHELQVRRREMPALERELAQLRKEKRNAE